MSEPDLRRSGCELWTVRLERHAHPKSHVLWVGEAVSEDEAIGKALRANGLHDGWDVAGWWPNGR
jgi:hypothetical protein